MAQGSPPDLYSEPRQKNIFRRRLLTLLLILLLVMLLARWASNRLAPGPPPAPTQAGSTNTAQPSPTITNIPDILFTPQITFTVIPTLHFPPTLTPTPGEPTPTESATPTPAPTEITRRACQGYGRQDGKNWVVAGCDTLLRISQVTGISLDRLLHANPEITDPNLIYPNQHILLPRR
jgi:hypothetical protein